MFGCATARRCLCDLSEPETQAEAGLETQGAIAMARIAGVDIPRDKRVVIALTYIYGIGRTVSQEILEATGIDENKRVNDLDTNELVALRDYIERHCRVEGDLRREVNMNIKRLMEIGSYRGLRHRRNLPSRGQRTRTNARTRRGVKKTVAGKKRARK